ncbi:MAG: ferredoxin oxidoreductase [Clostridia bacterium]|nr:ferredoxin oxidoreductase [Clostridia bacterium]
MTAVIERERRAFLTGNEVVAWAALAAGAEVMFGYPITPQNEIMHYWARLAPRYGRKFLQTEDELSAGYATIGAVLGGVKAFTATAGPGHVLMQEALAMAEMMRLPVVAIITQRGGPSTATVIYSQQEVNLACFGGNGEGFRLVYSVAGLQDLYEYTLKAFGMAWRYRLPTIVLGDGYQAKMRGPVKLFDPARQGIDTGMAAPFLGAAGTPGRERPPVHLRNTYNLEEELLAVVEEQARSFEQVAEQVAEYEEEKREGAAILLVAHGIVARAAQLAAGRLRRRGKAVGFFRPVTLRPFPETALRRAAFEAEMVLVAESAWGQLERLVRASLSGSEVPVQAYRRPGMGITPEELEEELEKILAARKSSGWSRGDEVAARAADATGLAP